MPGRASVDVRHAAKGSPAADVRRRVAPRITAGERASGDAAAGPSSPASPITLGPPDSAGPRALIAVGDRCDRHGRPFAEARQSGHEARPGEAVGFGEEEVQPDRGRLRPADPVDEVGQELPGPGPLAVTREAISSTATMTAGPESRTRGARRWQRSNQSPAAGDRAPGQEQGSEDEECEGADARPPARSATRPLRLAGRSGADDGRRLVRARRQPPRAATRPARPSDSELEPVVGGRDGAGTLTPVSSSSRSVSRQIAVGFSSSWAGS